MNKLKEKLLDKWFDLKYFSTDQIDKVRHWWKYCILGVVTLTLLLWTFTGWLVLEKEQIRVTDKGNKIKTEKSVSVESPQTASDVFYIYTDTITYRMEDNAFYLRFNTADDYGKMIVGKCYNVWSLGVRIGFLDMFENILYFEEVDCKFVK